MENRTFVTDGIASKECLKPLDKTIKIALHVEKWDQLEKFTHFSLPVTVKATYLNLILALSHYPKCENKVFILSIDTSKETREVSKSYPIQGFGQRICDDMALAAAHIANQFCEKNDLIINQEVSHWPILQYVVSVK